MRISGGRLCSLATCAAASAACAGEPFSRCRLFEHAPGSEQRWIALHCPAERGNGLGRLLELDVAATALLVQAAELRIQLLECFERGQGLGNALQAALRDGLKQQQFAMAWVFGQQRLGRCQHLRKLSLTQCRPQPRQIYCGRRKRRRYVRDFHAGCEKKSGSHDPPLILLYESRRHGHRPPARISASGDQNL